MAPAHISENNRRQSNYAARLGTDEVEKPLMNIRVTSGDEKHPAWLWTEDVNSEKLFCVRIGHSETKRLKLVDKVKNAIFIFLVHSIEN